MRICLRDNFFFVYDLALSKAIWALLLKIRTAQLQARNIFKYPCNILYWPKNISSRTHRGATSQIGQIPVEYLLPFCEDVSCLSNYFPNYYSPKRLIFHPVSFRFPSSFSHQSNSLLIHFYIFLAPSCCSYLLKRRMAMTMQTMKMTASTGPTTHSRPSSSSTIGWGSTSDEVTGSE